MNICTCTSFNMEPGCSIVPAAIALATLCLVRYRWDLSDRVCLQCLTLQHCTLCSYVGLDIVPAKVGLGLGWWDCRGCRNPIMGCSTPPLANFMNSQFSRKFIGTVLRGILKMLQFYHIDEKEFTDISGYPSYPFLILHLIWGAPAQWALL